VAADITLRTGASGAITLSSGAAAQSLTLPAISGSSSVYTLAAVVAGAVTLTLPTPIASSATPYALTRLDRQITLPSPIASTAAPYALARLDLRLTLPSPIASTAQPYALAQLAPGAVTLTLPTIASGSSPYTLTSVSNATGGDQALTLPSPIASSASPYAPTLAPGAVTLTLPTRSTTANVYVPTLTPGAVTLTLPVRSTTANVYVPSLAYHVSLPAISASSTPYALASIAIAASVQAIELEHIWNLQRFFGLLLRRVEGVTYEVGRRMGTEWYTCAKCGKNYPRDSVLVVNGQIVCQGPQTHNCRDQIGAAALRKDVRGGYEENVAPLPSIFEDL
jgi:hypothetical protein